MGRKSNKMGVTRRTILKGSAAAIGTGSLGGVTGKSTDSSAVLGDFETGLDAWKTNGGNKLTQVTASELPSSVSSGNNCLGIEINGDPHPMVENEKRVKDANFEANPYLTADVFAISENVQSDLVFAFRYHHSAPEQKRASPPEDGENAQTNEKRSNGTRQQKDELVIESEPIHVPHMSRVRISWNMTELPQSALANPVRLELTWYPANHPPEVGPRGRGSNKSFDYRGYVFVDNVRLSNEAVDLGAPSANSKRTALRVKHGRMVERKVEETTDDTENGVFVYKDGTEIPYSVEILDDGTFRQTVDGETFRVGGSA